MRLSHHGVDLDVGVGAALRNTPFACLSQLDARASSAGLARGGLPDGALLRQLHQLVERLLLYLLLVEPDEKQIEEKP